MRRTGVMQALVGALAAAGLLAGCEQNYLEGRFGSLTAQEDYYPIESHRGTVEPFGVPVREQGVGGAGQRMEDVQPEEGVELGFPSGDIEAWTVGSRQELDKRVWTTYPPPDVAVPLGTGKPLLSENGVWVQGTYGVEVGATGYTFARPGVRFGEPGSPIPQPQRGEVGEPAEAP